MTGRRLYALSDETLKGFITWTEKRVNAVMLFSTGLKAEEYWYKVMPHRPLRVYSIQKDRMEVFVSSMLNSDITYAVVDVPWQHADTHNRYSDEVVRDYAIVDLKKLKARFM
tara:strand:+ start:557 stop:892 length:336 start_codon:yes stop_codon:yes gene_type:complete